MKDSVNKIDELIEVMERLRGTDGCPWDKEQTPETLVPFIIEEAYEVIAAIDARSQDMLRDELGDLLFQIIFLSQLAKENGDFTMHDVVAASIDKMKRRHPHVFGSADVKTSEEVMENWEKIKKSEGKDRSNGRHLDSVPEHLPALLRAHKVTEKVSRVGFDWENIGGALAKFEEEVVEFKDALDRRDLGSIEEELGDILFSVVNVSRLAEVNPEDALRKTIVKFIRRFHQLERELNRVGKELGDISMQEMDGLWNAVKSREKTSQYRKVRKIPPSPVDKL